MTIRSTLIIGMLAVGILCAAIVGVLGTISIHTSVVREAQSRVNHDLDTMIAMYDTRIDQLADQLRRDVPAIHTADDPAAALAIMRDQLDLTVLNMCAADGTPLAGTYPSDTPSVVPVNADPVIRTALEGRCAASTVLLDRQRLMLEGGDALIQAARIPLATPHDNDAVADDALMRWAACPVKDATGRVTAVVYGGRMINHDYRYVDYLRDVVFSNRQYEGKPTGTVTVFMQDVRVATNVKGPDGSRAIGTKVSDEVRQKVLQQGLRWSGRAYVVDRWYISGYMPLKDLQDRTIGMLYVGLLEAPYNEMRTGMIVRFLGPVAAVLLVALVAAVWMVSRITRPLQRLGNTADQMAAGNFDHALPDKATYAEIEHLTAAFRNMQSAIAQRDRQLQQQNAELSDANEQLAQANRNYMQMLGFITHELKSPLAAMESLIDLLVDNFSEGLSEQARNLLTRIKRNCEEMRDMVKNYLDLSRAERGELAADMSQINLHSDVIEPVVSQNQTLFDSRSMSLEVECADDLAMTADADLLRIAVSNYLSNAAKYGKESGRAKLTVRTTEDNTLRVSVWNEGQGFTAEDKEKLFKKFSRLKNENTANKRGSGLGLFLSAQIIELHNGTFWAESVPGEWAEFGFDLPIPSVP